MIVVVTVDNYARTREAESAAAMLSIQLNRLVEQANVLHMCGEGTASPAMRRALGPAILALDSVHQEIRIVAGLGQMVDACERTRS